MMNLITLDATLDAIEQLIYTILGIGAVIALIVILVILWKRSKK